MKKLFSLTFVALFILTSCGGGGTQYRDSKKEKGSREWGPKEINSTVETMVASMYTYLRNDAKNDGIDSVLIQVKKIRNRTSEHIDTQMLSQAIVNNLMKKRIRFIDETFSADAIQEMEKGMTGMVDPEYAIPVGELRSPNVYLYGDISSNVRTVGGKTHQYLVVTLQLKQTSTNMMLWTDQKEFLKVFKDNQVSW